MLGRIKILIVLIMLQVLDLCTTFLAIRCGALELNPIVSSLMEVPLLLIVLKLIIAIITYAIALRIEDIKILIIILLLYAQAITINIINIVK